MPQRSQRHKGAIQGSSGSIFLPGTSLHMVFTKGSYYGTSASSITLVRALAGYQDDGSGKLILFAPNVPRITAKGFLVEEQRTNLCLQSQTFDNAAWGKTNMVVTPDQIAAPDGTLTADMLADTATNAAHQINITTIAFTTLLTYCFSFHAKAGTDNLVQLTCTTGAFSGSPYVNFNLQTGVVTSSGGSAIGSMVAMKDGWYRCIMVADATASANSQPFIARINNPTAARTPAYAGTGATIYAWGYQVEQGSVPSSYIPTTTASVLRPADVPTITGSAFSSFYRGGSVGTLFVDVDNYMTQGGLIRVDANNDTDRISDSVAAPTVMNFDVTTGNVNQASQGGGIPVGSVIGRLKFAHAYANNDVQAALNGAVSTVDTTTPNGIPTVSMMRIGAGPATTLGIKNYRQIAYYPSRQPSAQLQALTT